MYIRFVNICAIALCLVLVNACSGRSGDAKITELKALMEKHSELKTASLKDIKFAAGKSSNLLAASSIQTQLSTKGINSSVAQNAQILIETIISEFSVEEYLKATGTVIGILAQEQGGKCEDVKRTFEKEIDKHSDDVKKIQKEMDKKLNGCANIKGQEFANCLSYFNDITTFINDDMSCSDKSLNDVEKRAESRFKKPFKELENESKNCIENVFMQCDFNMQLE